MVSEGYFVYNDERFDVSRTAGAAETDAGEKFKGSYA
jgi:hypothetical protein